LGELYSIEVSPDMISTVTDAVIDEVRQWQARPLEKLYPIVYLDALIVKIRDEGRVKNKAVHIALGIGLDGKKEVLGMWIEENEGAKFWMRVLSEIKNRGVDDILIACCDGLTGFADAIAAVYPHTQVQLCLVHMVRQSTRFVVAKDRREVIASLKNIYYAPTIEAAEIALDELQQNWQQKYPTVVRSWQNNWPRITPCFAYPQELRRLVYTTNAIESMNYSLRKLLKTKALFPTDESVIKLLYLGLRNLSKKWIIMVKDWPLAYNQIAILFQERLI
jgi:putative transposase